MLRMKMNMMMALVVSLSLVASSAEAGFHDVPNNGFNHWLNGDMEIGGDATTPPTGWERGYIAPGGNSGASSDTPDDSNQSLTVSAGYVGGSSYEFAKSFYVAGADYGGLTFQVDYDYKGDVRVDLWDSVDFAEPSFLAPNTADWTHNSFTFVADPGTARFSFYLYDTTAGGMDAYLDNVVMVVIPAIPEPSTMTLLGIGGLALLFRRRK